MPFVQPYTYADGTSVQATDQEANDVAAIRYAAQGVLPADIANDSIPRAAIQRGRLGYRAFRGPYSEVYWSQEDWWEGRFDWITYQIKGGGEQTGSVQYRPLAGTGVKVVKQAQWQQVQLWLHGFVAVSLDEVDTTTYGWATSGRLENAVKLVHIQPNGGVVNHDAPVRMWAFEETTNAAVGKDPGNDISTIGARRHIPINHFETITTNGEHLYAVAIDPTILQGRIASRSIVAEVFFVS